MNATAEAGSGIPRRHVESLALLAFKPNLDAIRISLSAGVVGGRTENACTLAIFPLLDKASLSCQHVEAATIRRLRYARA